MVLESRDGSLTRVPVSPPGGDSRVGFQEGGGVVRLAIEGVRPAPATEPGERYAEVQLANGDTLRGELEGGRGESLELRLLGRSGVEIGIEDLRSILFPARTGRLAAPVQRPMQRPVEGDRLYWRKGASLDELDGAVAEFSAEGVMFVSVLGLKSFPWEEVAGLFVEAPDEAGEAAPEGGGGVVVDLFDGSRLHGVLSGLDASGALVALAGGAQVRLPLGTIAEILIDDGSVAYLSSLEPSEVVEGSPFGDDLGMVWPHRVDRSVSGGPLRARGRSYTRGLGVHAPSRIEWRLDGAWKQLRGQAALDEEVERLPARGSVRFRVWVDGETRWESPVLRGGDAPLEFGPIDLEGAQRLALEVDMAEDLHLGDRADWLRPLLLR